MRRVSAIALATIASLVWAGAAHAHPLGNFTVNRAAHIEVAPGRVSVSYTLDLAEIPTVQALPAVDTNADEMLTAAELQAWARAQASALLEDLRIVVDGEALTLGSPEAAATLSPGQAGLDVLRLTMVAAAPVASTRGAVTFTDLTGDDRPGWREVTAAGVDGVVLEGSDVPSVSPSAGLTAYPADAAERPLDVRAMRASFAPGVSAAGSSQGAAPSVPGFVGTDRLVSLLSGGGTALLALGLGLSVALGAWHALMPGHGKTLMAGAVVGSDAGVRQTTAIAAAVALMHTASVLALGVAVMGLEAAFRPEAIYPWLTVLAGAAALVVGASLARRRWSVWRHARGHERGHGHDHDHDHPLPTDGRLGLRGVGALALAGGIVPAPSALLVLLAAIHLHRTAAGVAMVLAFSAGLAVSLLAIGLGAVRARELVARRGSGRFAAAVPLAAAALTVVAGAIVIAGGVRGL
jgi:ABC-type nickel/cobalt efflux system permease component RcnA